MSVFVSWRGSDREIKNQLVQYLRQTLPEEEIWESDEGCKSNAYEEFILKIRQSEIFIVIVSDDAMKPSYVYNEIIEARQQELDGKLNMLVYKITDSSYTPVFAANLNHISDSNHVARLNGTSDGMRTLADRVRDLLDKRRRGEPENPYNTFVPEIEGTAISPGYYVADSRSDVFGQIDEAFSRSNVLFVSQISGYGKRCAVRQYAIQHQSEYKKILFLPFFSGSLRDFFARGITFTNLSSNLFDNMSENDMILRKARFLQKLGTDTLIIAPELIPDARDDRFVFDALSMVGCRIVFITQNASAVGKYPFPVISVKRMRDEHLKELFFHYYEAYPEEQQDLSECLSEFFDSIDGHTRSVEITANVLAESFGVYAEDVPEILQNIHPNSENELSERVFSLISDLFDMKNFSDTERKILLTASLFARIPMDEKKFVELLKACGCCDAKSLRLLIERGWILNDRMSRTIATDLFFADVCMGKVPLDEELLEQGLRVLVDEYTNCMFEQSLGSMYASQRRLLQCFMLLNLRAIADLTEQTILVQNEADIPVSTEFFGEMKSRINSEINGRFENDALKQLLREYADSQLSVIGTVDLLYSPDSSSRNEGLLARYFSLLETQFVEFEQILETPHTAKLKNLINKLQSFQLVGFVAEYERLVRQLCDSDSDDDETDTLMSVLSFIGELSRRCLEFMPYLVLRLCRAQYQLACFYGVVSYSRANIMYFDYLRIMRNLHIYEELDEIFESAWSMIQLAEKEGFYKDKKEYWEGITVLVYRYIDCLLDRGDLESAVQVLEEFGEFFNCTKETQKNYISLVDSIVNEALRIGDTETARAVLTDYSQCRHAEDLPSEKEDPQTADQLRMLQIYSDALLSDRPADDFKDGADEYLDYYRTYASGFADKNALRRYESIAEKARALDYSALSREEMLAKVGQLKKRAAAGTRREILMPEAFALVSEAGFRTLGYRHHLVQFMGGAAIADGNIAEIQNGEGKTYTILPAAFLHMLYGEKVYILDSSEYLTGRNYRWMRETLEYLGCTVGLLVQEGERARIEPLNFNDCDIVYASAYSLIFRKMREQLGSTLDLYRLPPFDAIIVDEADQLLIADGSQSYMLAKPTEDYSKAELADAVYAVISAAIASGSGDYFVCDPEKTGITDKIQLQPELYDSFYEYCREEGISLASHNTLVETFLRSCIDALLFHQKDRDYYIVDGRLRREDKSSGVFREYNGMYAYFLQKKEALLADKSVFAERPVINGYTVMELVREFGHIAGTTATASGMRREFREFYGLEVVSIPPNIPTKRIDFRPSVFPKLKVKNENILALIEEKHRTHQPVLVITDSIESSVQFSRALSRMGIQHTLLNAKNAEDGAEVLEKAGCVDAVTVTTALANRGVDIRLGGNPRSLAQKHLEEVGAVRANEEMSEELRRKLDDLTAVFRQQTEADRAYINSLGGLCVIGTSCFEELRIEQQTRGRCGRQGDSGESYLFFSLEDPGPKVLMGDRYDSTMRMIEMLDAEDGDLGNAKVLIRSIKNAREKLQFSRFSQMANLLTVRYRPDARKKLFSLIGDIENGRCDMDVLLDTYFAHSKENAQSLLALAARRPYSSMTVRLLASYLKMTGTVPKERDIPKLLMQALREYQKTDPAAVSDPKLLRELIVRRLRNSWGSYLSDMEREEREACNVINERRRYDKHILRFSEELYERLLEREISTVLTYRYKRKPDTAAAAQKKSVLTEEQLRDAQKTAADI